MSQQQNKFQTKKQDKTPEEQLSEVEISDWPAKEFKVTIIKKLNNVGRRMNEHNEKLEVSNKELEYKEPKWAKRIQ